MAGFILASTTAYDRATLDRLDATQQSAGFRKSLDRTIAGWRLMVYAPLSDAPAHVYERADGTVLACAGYLIYRGESGAAALGRMLADEDAGTISAADIYGHYALVRGDRDGWRLQNDMLGGFKIYHDASRRIFSNMFLSVFEALPDADIDPQGFYEYLWLGVSNGTRTFIAGLRSLPPYVALMIGPAGIAQRHRAPPDWMAPDMAGCSMDELVVHYGGQMMAVMGALAGQFGDRINTALSGGFDSRLILAALLAHGVRPRLFSYGRARDHDRRVAERTARAMGLALEAIDKSQLPKLSPAAYDAHIARNLVVFDGWKPTGIFDNGSDFDDRIHRLAQVGAIINGSGGECLRNFFYLPDRRYSLEDLVSTFYSTHAPWACTDAFDEAAYRAALTAQLGRDLDLPAGCPLPRTAVELAYPLFRVRYWSARDMAVNQRFGWAYYPFLQPQLIAGTPTIPLRFKTHGRLEARIIRALSPRLAVQPSDYGFAFDAPVPWRYRAKMLFTYLRPPWARRYSYRVRYALPRPRPYYLKAPYLGRFVDPALPAVSTFVHPRRLHDEDAFNRAATVEYLLAWHKARRRG
ncbi:MAG: hypothetical protein D6782_01420 [Alphaproteobacteria bacterium]|nr:MAG: hypothetical protein D6782_01420 [Alphaproteobacteria bacterium]